MFRFRFRLITLLTAMTLIALAAACYGMYHRAMLAEQQADIAEQKVLAKIAGKGAWIIQSDAGDVTVEFFAKQPATPPILDCGTGVRRVYHPTGNGVDFTDPDLKLFDGVRVLSYIKLEGTSVSVVAQAQFKSKHPRCHFED